jgi:hypothetical protein
MDVVRNLFVAAAQRGPTKRRMRRTALSKRGYRGGGGWNW